MAVAVDADQAARADRRIVVVVAPIELGAAMVVVVAVIDPPACVVVEIDEITVIVPITHLRPAARELPDPGGAAGEARELVGAGAGRRRELVGRDSSVGLPGRDVPLRDEGAAEGALGCGLL